MSAVADLDDPNGWTGYTRTRQSRGQVFTRSELAGLPGVMPLVDGLLSFPAAVVLVGGYSLGKSALAHGIAGSVATGRMLRAAAHPRQGRQAGRHPPTDPGAARGPGRHRRPHLQLDLLGCCFG